MRSESTVTLIRISTITYLNPLFHRKLVPAPWQVLPSLQASRSVSLSVTPPNWPQISASGSKIPKDPTPVSCWIHFKMLGRSSGNELVTADPVAELESALRFPARPSEITTSLALIVTLQGKKNEAAQGTATARLSVMKYRELQL